MILNNGCFYERKSENNQLYVSEQPCDAVCVSSVSHCFGSLSCVTIWSMLRKSGP